MKRLFIALAGVALVAAVGLGMTSTIASKPTMSQSVSKANPVVMSGVIQAK